MVQEMILWSRINFFGSNLWTYKYLSPAACLSVCDSKGARRKTRNLVSLFFFFFIPDPAQRIKRHRIREKEKKRNSSLNAFHRSHMLASPWPCTQRENGEIVTDVISHSIFLCEARQRKKKRKRRRQRLRPGDRFSFTLSLCATRLHAHA